MTTAIEEYKDRVRKRRAAWPIDFPEEHVLTYKIHPYKNRQRMLRWIDEHTSGRFYLGGNKIAFVEERDVLMFKLGFKDE